MADLSDVLQAVYGQVVNAVYPNGTSQPSVADVDVTIIQGWPMKSRLDDALKAGKSMVSVFPTNKEKDITKFERIYKTVSVTDPTIVATVSELEITLSGTISVPQSIIATINNVSYQYTVLITDTINSVAASLAALIPGASSVGAVITLAADTYSVVVSIATASLSALELGRQEREFMIAIWATSSNIRKLIGQAVDVYMRENYQFPIAPDNFNIMIFYSHTDESDKFQIPLILRRDLFYKIQYSTTKLETFMTVAKTISNLTVLPGGSIQ